MRGLCGWFSLQPRQDGATCLDVMLRQGRIDAAARLPRHDAHAGLATYGSSPTLQFVERDGCWLALAGHPRRQGQGPRMLDAATL